MSKPDPTFFLSHRQMDPIVDTIYQAWSGSFPVLSSLPAAAPLQVSERLERERAREIFFDRLTGRIGYGKCYGEYSYNGRPLYSDFMDHAAWQLPQAHVNIHRFSATPRYRFSATRPHRDVKSFTSGSVSDLEAEE